MPTLYEHQRTGRDWLVRRRVGILADDMGVGKTATAIAAARAYGIGPMHDPVLVVAPTVMLWKWAREFELWIPGARVQVVDHGRATLFEPESADIVIVTHGLILRPWIQSQLLAEQWSACIVDEAHAFKSLVSEQPDQDGTVSDSMGPVKRTMALYHKDTGIARRAAYVWLLTGTPMPNHTGELYPHLVALAPERIQHAGCTLSYAAFIDRFCLTRPTPYGTQVIGNRRDRLPELRKRLDGFILRRTKDQVLKNLPPVSYETFHLRPPKLDHALQSLSDALSPTVLEALENASGDTDALFRVLGSSAEIAKFRRLCGLVKAPLVAELLDLELGVAALDKVVIAAWHREVIAVLAGELAEYGVRTITGDTPPKLRDQYAQAFQNDPDVRVIVCNIMAGGVGIDLFAASEMVFVEYDWTPGNNAQMADRIRRIGQTRACRVRLPALAGTIDEPITQSTRRKLRMTSEVLDG